MNTQERAMKPFYISFPEGCTVIYAATAASARRYAVEEFGRSNGPYTVSNAEEKDIAYVRAMGGGIHREPQTVARSEP